MELLSVIGAGASLALGLLGFVNPQAALRLVGLQLVPGLAHSISEVRATYGGIFIGMSLYALLSQEPHAFLAVAAAWIMAALARILSALVDNAITPANIGGIVVELAIGSLIAWPWLPLLA
jgi:hypothetical protein